MWASERVAVPPSFPRRGLLDAHRGREGVRRGLERGQRAVSERLHDPTVVPPDRLAHERIEAAAQTGVVLLVPEPDEDLGGLHRIAEHHRRELSGRHGGNHDSQI